jgi:hypothetical protein
VQVPDKWALAQVPNMQALGKQAQVLAPGKWVPVPREPEQNKQVSAPGKWVLVLREPERNKQVSALVLVEEPGLKPGSAEV